MLELEHPKINPEMVRKALLLERYEHPFLRVVLSSSNAEFMEDWNQTYDVHQFLYDHPYSFLRLNSKSEI